MNVVQQTNIFTVTVFIYRDNEIEYRYTQAQKWSAFGSYWKINKSCNSDKNTNGLFT